MPDLIVIVIASVVKTVPVGKSAFTAHFRFPDGRERTYRLTGDALS